MQGKHVLGKDMKCKVPKSVECLVCSSNSKEARKENVKREESSDKSWGNGEGEARDVQKNLAGLCANFLTLHNKGVIGIC